MQGFEYPIQCHTRRHGPGGYRDYESYRDWLRDEFHFRCVYCLHRERWCARGAAFDIDHFVPVSCDEGLTLEYSNLLYACSWCNQAKSNILKLPDPCKVAFGECLRITDDGSVECLNDDGKALVSKLRLNKKSSVEFRSRWMRVLSALRISDMSLYVEFLSFPSDLPDLRTKHSPTNSQPGNVADCYFARQERGELPEVY